MNKIFLTLLLSFISILPAMGQDIIGGIGAQLILDTAGGHTMPRIFRTIPNTPAYDSLNATDYIIKVNGISCRDKTMNEVVNMIRGKAGTTVHITVADTKQGEHPRSYNLARVGMNVPAPPDPVAAFNKWCDQEANSVRGKGFTLIRSFSSDCGNYFFNFNAERGSYHVRLYTLIVGTGKSKKAFTASAKVFNSDHEDKAITLKPLPPVQQGNITVAKSEGVITFNSEGIGAISTSIQDNAKKCRAMYIIVYK